MRLGLVEIERLFQRRDNPRRMSEEEYAALQKSVEKFGFSTFIVVEEEEPGRFGVIDGHHRWKLAQEKGMKRVPVVVLPKNADYNDLAMLTFNVGGSPRDDVFVNMLAELTKKLGASEVAGFTALDADFLEELSKTAASAAKLLEDAQGSAGTSPTEGDGTTGEGGWQGKPMIVELPSSPEVEALLKRVSEITGQEVTGLAVLSALKTFVELHDAATEVTE